MHKYISTTRYIIAFVAGFLAVLFFHQGMLGILHAINFTPRAPFSAEPTKPYGVPQIWSSAFWGGVWGLVFAAVAPRFPGGDRYWLAALLFGALAPTLVAWFVVMPLKGQPIAGGWQPATIILGLLVNGAWGLGTALFFLLLSRWQK